MERHIEGTTTLRASVERAMRVVCIHDDLVLGASSVAAARHRELGLGPIHHEIALELGAPVEERARVIRPIRWAAAMHPDRFPVFDGELVIERDDDGHAVLGLRGTYHTPFGPVGSFGDGVAGRRIARACIAGLVRDVAIRIDRAAEPLVDPDEPYVHDVVVSDVRAAAAASVH